MLSSIVQKEENNDTVVGGLKYQWQRVRAIYNTNGSHCHTIAAARYQIHPYHAPVFSTPMS